jgi:hypothetical protein
VRLAEFKQPNFFKHTFRQDVVLSMCKKRVSTMSKMQRVSCSTLSSRSSNSFGLAAEKRQAGEIEMHHRGWQFTTKGDATKGREVFEKFACYVCHEIRGEKFPASAPGSVLGPELSQMGPLHPLEYFTESVVNPGAHAAKNTEADGKSAMPAANDRGR